MKRNTCFLLVSVFFLASFLNAQPTAQPEMLRVWPAAAPSEKGDLGPEKTSAGNDNSLRYYNVSEPNLTVFRAPKDKNTGAALLICPGGGYDHVTFELEGTMGAKWLNDLGVTAVVLKYRVPARKGLERGAAPIQDAQRAMGLIRAKAKDWEIDPQKVGIMGFSAGGHMAAALSNHDDQRTYEPIDDADKLPARPNFALLIYPAYLVKGKGAELNPEVKVSSKTPPTFLALAADDGTAFDSSLGYFQALKSAKVPAELHIYTKGGHGFGMRSTNLDVSTWTQRASDWLKATGFLKKN